MNFETYRNDPIGFCRDVLGLQLWDAQAKITESVRDNERTAVSKCFSGGATTSAAATSLWWSSSRFPALTVVVCPTKRLRDRFFRETMLILGSQPKLAAKKRKDQIDLQLGRGFILGCVGESNSIAGMVGFENVLLIEYCADLIPDSVSVNYDGLTSHPGSRHLIVGSPTHRRGRFLEAFQDELESSRWHHIAIDALESPNYKAGATVVPGLVTREWIDEFREHSMGNDVLWNSKVRGRFTSPRTRCNRG